MAKEFKKANLKFKSLHDDNQIDVITMGDVIEQAGEAEVAAVRAALDTLIEHPVTEVQVTTVHTFSE